jgi:serine/threonine protein kinase
VYIFLNWILDEYTKILGEENGRIIKLVKKEGKELVVKCIPSEREEEIERERYAGVFLAQQNNFLVEYEDIFEENGFTCFVMEYFKEGNLLDLIDKRFKDKRSSFEEKV